MESCRGKLIDKEFWQNKKVLITGLSGFKGFWLYLTLKALGSEVHGISIENYESQIFKRFNKIEEIQNHTYLDITDYKNLKKYFEELKPNIVFHLAAQPLVISSKIEPFRTVQTNIIGTFNLLEIIANSDIKVTSVFATTDKVYKNPHNKNIENDPLGSFELYGATKVACEELIKSFNENENFINKFSVIRAGNILGSGDGGKNRLLTDILDSINSNNSLNIRNPNSTRPWQYVLDSIGGYLLAAELHSKTNNFEIFNINNIELNELSVLDIANAIISKFKSKIDINISKSKKYKEAEKLVIDSSKAMKQLDWKCFYSLEMIANEIYIWNEAKDVDVISISTKQVDDYLNCFSK